MSFVKYRVKEVAADFGMAPKEIADIVGKFGEKPKSNTQVLTEEELNMVFDYVTQTHQIQSLEQVFAVKPKEQPKAEAPKAPEAPKAAPQQPRQQNNNFNQGNRPQGQNNNQQPRQNNQPRQQNNFNNNNNHNPAPAKQPEPERKRERPGDCTGIGFCGNIHCRFRKPCGCDGRQTGGNGKCGRHQQRWRYFSAGA